MQNSIRSSWERNITIFSSIFQVRPQHPYSQNEYEEKESQKIKPPSYSLFFIPFPHIKRKAFSQSYVNFTIRYYSCMVAQTQFLAAAAAAADPGYHGRKQEPALLAAEYALYIERSKL